MKKQPWEMRSEELANMDSVSIIKLLMFISNVLVDILSLLEKKS